MAGVPTHNDWKELTEPRQRPEAEHLVAAVGYDSPEEFYDDAAEYSQEVDEDFKADEFAEEYGIESARSVDNVLSALQDYDGYEISKKQEIEGGDLVNKFEVG